MEQEKKALSFDEVSEWLDEVASTIPEALFEGLNGGVILLREIKFSPHAQKKDLYILGQYNHDPYGLGRYIQVYYGSFLQVYGKSSEEKQKQGLRELLLHELTHHIESLAGVRDLEVKDEIFLDRYQKKQEIKSKKGQPDKENTFFRKKLSNKKE